MLNQPLPEWLARYPLRVPFPELDDTCKPERPRFDAHTATTSDAKNQKNKSPISTSAKPL